MSGGEVGLGVGTAEGVLVGEGFRFWHTVLENGVHFFTSTSPDLHLWIYRENIIIRFKTMTLYALKKRQLLLLMQKVAYHHVVAG